jgi:predicted AAA+ superfamily ATPase
LVYGGFPEPFRNGTTRFYNRWKKSHLDIILKQDLIDLERVQQIIQIEILIQLLKNRVGSPVSYSSLAQDLQCSDKTVKRWNDENLSPNFKVFKQFFPQIKMTQITKELKREKTFPNGAEIRIAHSWLAELNLS